MYKACSQRREGDFSRLLNLNALLQKCGTGLREILVEELLTTGWHELSISKGTQLGSERLSLNTVSVTLSKLLNLSVPPAPLSMNTCKYLFHRVNV